ncbi:YfiR family protein [Desulfoluna sp.]|uniref:YfiR family protein n=1 Tax=Desulfoluna sp. TaxID=2045199 RepID=UPI002634BA40|nr:YfiR family protein [Desulfoluna sp.]
MTIKRLIVITGLLFSIALHGGVPPPLHAEPATESRIKAAYLLNFARFVTWPDVAFESSVSPIVLCVLGEDSIDSALPTIQYKRVQDRPLVIQHIDTLADLPACHMLFVGEIKSPDLPQVLSALASRPILTVSSLPDFSLRGGMLTFIKAENRIRFEVNLSTTQMAGLTISSRLLKLARLVP